MPTIPPDILVISRTFFPKEGGIEEYVYNRCLQDPERIVLLAANHPGSPTFNQQQTFPIYRWSNPDFKIGFIGNILKQILNMVWSFVLAIKLYFRYRYQYIEWGHGYDFPAILLLSYILPIRFFIYLHGNDILCPLGNPVLRSLFQFTLNRAEGIICNSAFTRDYLMQHCQIKTDIHVINPTVRPEKFGSIPNVADSRSSIRQTYNIPESAIVILSVGRLVKRKGCDRVLRNLPTLIQAGFDIHYIICGRGAMESAWKSLSCDLGIQNRVHFAGYISDLELANYYAACDIFALPTFFDPQAASIEGFGIVYLEAGYFGKAVIASRIGGVVDAVQHHENGILVNPDDEAEIGGALRLLCEDEGLRGALGLKGREFAGRKTLHQVIY